MPQDRITFANAAGDRLAARLDRPDGPVRAWALFAHCFTCGKDIAAARRIAARLAEGGIGVMRFDFTGLGHSGGEFGNTGFHANVDDLVAAAEHMRAQGMAPEILIGHSLGGAAVLAATPRIGGIKAVATIGAPHDPSHVLRRFGADLEKIRDEGMAEVTLVGRTFTVARTFLENTETATLDDTLGQLGAALMVLHAPRDAEVSIENAAAIFTAAKHPKSFVSLDDADHLLTRGEDAAYAADVIAAWASRFAGSAPEPTLAADQGAAPEGVTRSTERDPAGFLQDVRMGPHAIAGDEPVHYGGTDKGPTPYQFLAAALATCTSMTIRMYARRKQIPLASVSVDVTHDKVHATDCEGCEEAPRKIDLFRRTLHLKGALSDADRAKLVAIADRCPVHRTLEAGARVETIDAAPVTG
ncbi:MAG: bifunctional alpha/beta hydrolase/OsmC family protein [Pseudomonadota bacterium]